MKENKRSFIYDLENIINQRIAESDESSYTFQLISSGSGLMAKKLVEESAELAVASFVGRSLGAGRPEQKMIIFIVYHWRIYLDLMRIQIYQKFMVFQIKDLI